ncbi:MAG: hypothetical protein ACYCY7_13780, partial [Gallionella sp.]
MKTSIGCQKALRSQLTIDTSIIHDILAVIANEVKQSSKTKMHFFKPSGLPRRLRLLMKLLVERLAIPLSNQKTVAKWLVIANRL